MDIYSSLSREFLCCCHLFRVCFCCSYYSISTRDIMSSANTSATSLGKAEGGRHTDKQTKGSWKKAPFFVKPGPRFGHRLGQSLKRWWPLHFFIIAAVTLLIVLPV